MVLASALAGAARGSATASACLRGPLRGWRQNLPWQRLGEPSVRVVGAHAPATRQGSRWPSRTRTRGHAPGNEGYT